MGQFLKFTLASCLGVFVAFLLIFFIFAGIIGMLVSASGAKTVHVSSSSVIEVELEGIIPEKTNNVEMAQFNLKQQDILGLHEIIDLIQHAAVDENIKGIYLKPENTYLGIVSYQELIDALEEFKESGKFVVSYAPYYSQGPYYLASVSDMLFLNPIGSVDFRGFAAFVPFFKDLMDKTGIGMHIFYAGDFKSASEPFRRNSMSDESKLQTREYLATAYDEFLDNISSNRNISNEELRRIANQLLSRNSEAALNLRLVDRVAHEPEAIDWIRENMGLEPETKINMVSMYDYYLSKPIPVKSAPDRIAVVYAEGEITSGEEAYGIVNDKKYAEIFQELKENSKVKATVLRVNSPGGSILASDNILKAIRDYKESGKPLIVSMGDYAASGGYYISCAADEIFAEENTITGSIGVYAMLLNFEELLNDKLGVHFDTVKTGDYSSAFTSVFDWSDAEALYWQQRTDGYYQLFLEIVAEARDMSVEEVHEIAQGRVWSGRAALDRDLVDQIGNLEDAISACASLAELEEYKITEYPKTLNPLNKFISDLTGQESNARSSLIKQELEAIAPGSAEWYYLLSEKGPIARLPVRFEFN